MEKTSKSGIPEVSGKLDWSGASEPAAVRLSGRHAQLLPLDAARDAPELWSAYADDHRGEGWNWLPYGPFDSRREFDSWLLGLQSRADPLFMTIRVENDGRHRATGMAAFMRFDPGQGVIEIGHIHLAPSLQRTAAATEALYLMMRTVFEDWGYRRLEWKCDSQNAPSRRAAERLGFCFEGLFRQHMVVKGRNRDTAWYSIIDGEWPAVKAAVEAWLAPDNFDEQGRQRRSLSQLRHALQGDGEQL